MKPSSSRLAPQFIVPLSFAISAGALLPSAAWATSFLNMGSNETAFQQTQALQDAQEQFSAQSAIETQLNQGTQRLKKKRLFKFAQKLQGIGITTHKFKTLQDGIEILGGAAFFHKGKLGTLVRGNTRDFDVSTSPTLSAQEALSIAQGMNNNMPALAAPQLKILPSQDGDSARLIYVTKIAGTEEEGGHDVYVDAQSGEVLASISHHQHLTLKNLLKQISVLEAGNSGCQTLDRDGYPTDIVIKKCPATYFAGQFTPSAGQESKDAAANAKLVVSYFKTNHNRDSFDGKGSRLTSIVKVGKKFSNAFWNSQDDYMAYGEGDGVMFGDFTRGLDVAGHEMTHGVTSHTSDLVYMSESGALNEAFSDYFGVIISGAKDWSIGKALYLDASKAKGIRDLSNPGSLTYRTKTTGARKPYPAHMKEKLADESFCHSGNDNCWVHINSTIPGHAFYRVNEVLGTEKASKLIYTVLTQFLDNRSDFKEARDATLEACKQAFGKTDCEKVRTAYAAVGL